MNAPFKPLREQISVKVSPSGKMHLPSALRKELGLENGGLLIIESEGKSHKITSLRAQMEAMREKLAPYFKNDSVDQFLADRREEAKREWEEDE